MAKSQSNIHQKIFAIVFGIIFSAIIGLLALTFFNKEPRTKTSSKVYPHDISTIWTALTNKQIYLSSKPEITHSVLYDSLSPTWVEYYGKLDSINNQTINIVWHKKWQYNIINRKHEMVNNISIILDSVKDGTKVSISEKSIYQNIWARTYFGVIKPQTVLEYEFVKLNNCLSQIQQIKSITNSPD